MESIRNIIKIQYDQSIIGMTVEDFPNTIVFENCSDSYDQDTEEWKKEGYKHHLILKKEFDVFDVYEDITYGSFIVFDKDGVCVALLAQNFVDQNWTPEYTDFIINDEVYRLNWDSIFKMVYEWGYE